MIEFLRDERGRHVERVVSVPFRPEYICFMKVDGTPATSTPWAQEALYGVPDPGVPVRTDLRAGAKEPDPLCAHRFGIDLRAAEKYGIDPLCVVRVELPTLDYTRADPLEMRVFVRVRAPQ